MTDFLLRASAARVFEGDVEFASILQEGMRHYEKYINQMLDESRIRDLPLVIACLEASLRTLKGNNPEAVEVSDVILERTMTIMTALKTGGDKG